MADATPSSFRYGIVVAAIAAAAPVTAAIHGAFAQHTELQIASVSKSKELELATREQDFKMRMEFLDRAIDATRTPEDRQQVLRFLRAVSADEALRQWAEAELASVQQDVDTLHEARDQLARALTRESELSMAEATARSRQPSTAAAPDAAAATIDKAEAERELTRARERLRILQTLRTVELETRAGAISDPTDAVRTRAPAREQK